MTLPEWLLTTSALLAGAVALALLARRARVPLTVVLVVIGLIAGWVGKGVGFEIPLEGEGFEEVVVFLFLPVLVFEAALGLSTRAFFRNLGPIVLLATVAVAISAVVVGLALKLGLGTPLTAALVFGALISATDPVAVVAVFRQLGVPRRLLTLVEGESMLNDGVAIVLTSILVAAALGGQVDVLSGFLDFLAVFFGGAAIGLALGLVVALLLPWLDRLSSAALSIAIVYGSFVLADDVLGFSGVLAVLAAGVTLGGLAPSRASAAVRRLWEDLWEALGFVANAILFLLIGLAIEPALITDNAGAIGLAIVAVLVARVVAVVPLVSLLQRLTRIPPVGARNEAVLVWGGLRGGVALALALALPDELEQRELFIAMTGGVVLATLLLNATTISWLIHRLGLDEPSRADRFLAGVARLAGIRAARERVRDLGLDDETVARELQAAERAVRAELERLDLEEDEEARVVLGRGLVVERQTYQRLSDLGLLPPSATRSLLHEVDDQIEEIGLGHISLERARRRERPKLERLAGRLIARLPKPAGEDPSELAFSEALARRLGAGRAEEALDTLGSLPNIDRHSVDDARQRFVDWERAAARSLSELDATSQDGHEQLRRHQAEALGRAATEEELRELSQLGVLPESVTRPAVEEISGALSGSQRPTSR